MTQSKKQKEEKKATLNLINQEFKWNQYQYIDTDVNLGYEDIQFGDVFEISINEFYKRKFKQSSNKVVGVLITQSCDCIVRKDSGMRKDAIVKLLLFNEKNTLEHDDNIDVFGKGIFLFKNSNNNPISYFVNDESLGMICVDGSVLDLTSFNIEGLAKVLPEEAFTQIIKLKKSVAWQQNMCENFKLKNLIGKEFLSNISDQENELIEAQYGIKYSKQDSEFLIKRLGRLTYNNAHTVLSKYINNINRVGKESPSTINNTYESKE